MARDIFSDLNFELHLQSFAAAAAAREKEARNRKSASSSSSSDSIAALFFRAETENLFSPVVGTCLKSRRCHIKSQIQDHRFYFYAGWRASLYSRMQVQELRLPSEPTFVTVDIRPLGVTREVMSRRR